MAKNIKNSRASLTRHASARMQQRGIDDTQIQLIEIFGDAHYQKGGTDHLYISRKVMKALRHAIDKLEAVSLIIGEEDKIITVMHQSRKIRSTQFV